jgi:hypothetical protein
MRARHAVVDSSQHTQACFFIVFNNEKKLECTPRMRHKNKEEFSQGELDAQAQTPGL